MAASSSSGSSTHPLIRRPEELGYWNPARLRHFVETAEERWDAVCQILRSDKPGKGTGCLIGGNFLLTNHHVIESIEAAKNATACFFQVVSQTARKEKTVVRIIRIALDPDRYFFTCHGKMSGILKVPQPADEDHLDFTIVALQRDSYLSSIQQKVFSIFKPFAHFEGEEIYIIHHPDRVDGETVIADPETTLRGDVKVSHGVLKKAYPYYVHYSTSAHRGSSGGAAINVEGQIIALHYQTIRTCREGCTSDSSCYSGIRMDQIINHLTEKGQKEIIAGKIREDREHYRSDLSNHLIEYYRQKLKTSVYNIGEAGDWTADFPIEGIYTNLAIIGDAERKERQGEKSSFEDLRIPTHETLYKSKKPIHLEEIFNNGMLKDAHKKRLVIFGVAGVGKTTFCEMAAIKGRELWPQFSTVFLIKLRHLNSDNYRNSEDYTVYEVLAKECGFVLEDFEEVLKLESFRRDSLLILDGFDELPQEVRSESSPLKNLLKNLMEIFDHVVITSRPMRVSLPGVSLELQCELEIIGFDDENINLYADKFYKQLENQGKILGGTADEKIKEFHLGLQSRSVLHTLVQIPINLTLACSIFNDNEAAFDIPQGLSLTSFYILTVKWLYNRFLSCPRSSSTSSYDLEADPMLDPTIESIDRTLQSIAWIAMEKNVIQLQEHDVNLVLRENKVTFGDLKNIGLMKFENKSWEFIHLTFQEYYAAVHLARFYIDGKTKKEKKNLLRKGKKRLSKIKFDPRYMLTLWMIAGYLSDRGNTSSLQAFFNHLFDEPRDLAKHYELRLFAQCFEECKDYESIIPQYSAFIEACVGYISTMPPKNLIGLLNHNPKLSAHKDVVDVIYSRTASDQLKTSNRLEMIEMLDDIASNRRLFFRELRATLELIAFDPKLDDRIRESAVLALGENIQEGELLSEKGMSALIEVIKNPLLTLIKGSVIDKVVSALIKAATWGGMMSEAVIETLVRMVKDVNLSEFFRVSVVEILGKIAKKGGVIPDSKIGILIKIINNVNLNNFIKLKKALTMKELLRRKKTQEIRRDTVSVIVGVIRGEETTSRMVIEALMEILKDANLDSFTKGDVASAVGEIAKRGGVIPEATIELLVEMTRDVNLNENARGRSASALGEIAKRGRVIPKAVIEPLVEMIRDVNLNENARGRSAKALGKIAKRGKVIPETVIEPLVEMIRDVNLNENARGRSAKALSKIAKRGRAMSEVVMRALMEMIKDIRLDERIRGIVVSVLGEIVRSEGEICEIAMKALVEIVKDGNLNRYIRGKVVSTLEEIVTGERAISDVAIETLVEMIKDANLDKYIRENALKALDRIAQKGQLVSAAGVIALEEVFNDESWDWVARVNAFSALREIAKREDVVPRIALDQLVEALKRASLNRSDISAAEALGGIARERGVMSEVAIGILVDIANDSGLKLSIREGAVTALGEIAQIGEVVFEVTIKALAEMVGCISLGGYYRRGIASTLGEISRREGAFSIIALEALESQLADSDIQDIIIFNLEKMNPRSLITVITDIDSAKLVLRVCALIQKAFSLADGQIHISDNNCRVSIQNPGIDEGMIRAYADGLIRIYINDSLERPLSTNTSLSSSYACSSSD